MTPSNPDLMRRIDAARPPVPCLGSPRSWSAGGRCASLAARKELQQHAGRPSKDPGVQRPPTVCRSGLPQTKKEHQRNAGMSFGLVKPHLRNCAQELKSKIGEINHLQATQNQSISAYQTRKTSSRVDPKELRPYILKPSMLRVYF